MLLEMGRWTHRANWQSPLKFAWINPGNAGKRVIRMWHTVCGSCVTSDGNRTTTTMKSQSCQSTKKKIRIATNKSKRETETMIPSTVSLRDPSTVKSSNEQRPDANQLPSGVNEDGICILAYSKWEAAECLAGDGLDFWLDAEHEIRAAQSGSSAAESSLE